MFFFFLSIHVLFHKHCVTISLDIFPVLLLAREWTICDKEKKERKSLYTTTNVIYNVNVNVNVHSYNIAKSYRLHIINNWFEMPSWRHYVAKKGGWRKKVYRSIRDSQIISNINCPSHRTCTFSIVFFLNKVRWLFERLMMYSGWLHLIA